MTSCAQRIRQCRNITGSGDMTNMHPRKFHRQLVSMQCITKRHRHPKARYSWWERSLWCRSIQQAENRADLNEQLFVIERDWDNWSIEKQQGLLSLKRVGGLHETRRSHRGLSALWKCLVLLAPETRPEWTSVMFVKSSKTQRFPPWHEHGLC